METDWLKSRSRITPDKTAVIEGETGLRWSFSQLNQRAECLAAYLNENGIVKGDRVALLSPNHISYFDLLFACGKIGAIFVPLNWRLSQAELSYILKDCSPKLLAYHKQMENVAQGFGIRDSVVVNSNEYDNIMERASRYDVEGSDIADALLIIYTGGTTGKPKGVVLPHRAVLWNGLNTVLSWNLTSEDVTLTYLPMFHTGGLNALSIPILQVGGTVIIGRDFEPNAAIELMVKESCTIVLMVPTMYHLIVQTELFHTTKFPSMHTFLSGGAPCPITIYEAFKDKGITFKEGYGLTEAGPNNFYMDPKMVLQKKGSVGKPMMFNGIRIVDRSGNVLSAGEVGEVLIQGNHVFECYWNNPTATQESLCDGWLHTGDLGRFDDDGFFYIVGRKKDMIITGGENVYPLEVENILFQHPAVNECVIVGLPDEKWGEMVAAIIVLNTGKTLTLEELQNYCQTKIAKYKIPKKMFIVDKIPKTHVGKIDKKEIVKQFA